MMIRAPRSFGGIHGFLNV